MGRRDWSACGLLLPSSALGAGLMATRADVARRAGVSPSTVTYVLNGQRPIGAEVRERVLAAMAELRYKPNAVAAALAGGRSSTLALLLPTSERGLKESDLQYVVGATEAARELGYRMLLSTAERSDFDELAHLTGSGLVDGVVLMEVWLDDERPPYLTERGIPFSLIGRTQDITGLDYADRDFAEIGRMAISYLRDLGHAHVAFLDAPPRAGGPGYGVSVRVVDGLLRAAEDCGVDLLPLSAALTVDAGREVLEDLLVTNPEVTALVAFNDEALMGVYLSARELGMRIPEDLSVLSSSLSAQMATFFYPPITTISPPAAQIAASATRALVRRLRKLPDEGGPHLFAGDLVVRASTGAPRVGQWRVPAKRRAGTL